HAPFLGCDRRARRAQHAPSTRRRAGIGNRGDGVHPGTRRRTLAATWRRRRTRGRGHRSAPEPRSLIRMQAEVVVVGAGIMGSATAYALARQGRDVLLLEQFHVGHGHGSSHGRSRIVRLAYPEVEFVELAREAFAGWRDLEQESGQKLLELNGLLELVESAAQSTAGALEAAGAEYELLDAAGAGRPRPGRGPGRWAAALPAGAG